MAIPQNWWQGNRFNMPAIPAGLLYQTPQPTSQGLLAAGVNNQPQQGLLTPYLTDNGDGTATGSAQGGGASDPGMGPSADVGIGAPSGTPGSGGIGGVAGGMASAISAMTNPVGFALGMAVNSAMGRKSTAQHIADVVNGLMGNQAGIGVSPSGDSTTGGATGVGAGVGSGATAGPNSTAANMGTAADPEASVSVGAGVGTGAVGGTAGVGANVGTSADPEASVSTADSGGGAGGGSGAGDGGTVICTMLHQMGDIPDDVYLADAEYGKNADAALIAGYHSWAVPYVRLCRRNNLVGHAALGLAKRVAIPWAREMAYRAGVLPKGSRLGAFLFAYGVPVCRLLGKLIIALHAARIRPA